MKQKQVFVDGEGDRYYARNRDALEALARAQRPDPALQLLDAHAPVFSRVLEVGCSNGWRLKQLRERVPDCIAAGIDPSFDALRAPPAPGEGLLLAQGTADALPFASRSVDLLVFGFCLYLCDREDLFRIVSEADRVLEAGGHLLILDFHAEEPARREYHHAPGVYSYKADYGALFTASPQYALIEQRVVPEDGAELAVWLLRKQPVAEAYVTEDA